VRAYHQELHADLGLIDDDQTEDLCVLRKMPPPVLEHRSEAARTTTTQ